MSDVTQILNAIEAGDAQAAEQLLPLVYDDLRKLAAAQMARETPGQTLDATALVHEAWMRLVPNAACGLAFANRRHFIAAAAEAMRRILVDRVRAKQSLKRGGDGQRVPLPLELMQSRFSDSELIETDFLLDDFAKVDSTAAELVRMHVFGGFSLEEAGNLLGVSRATAYRNWTFARAWLRDALISRE
jgi:RNA polymerase sigma factor (TIGR02999 family)